MRTIGLFLILSLLTTSRPAFAAIRCAGIFAPAYKASGETLKSIDASIADLAKLRLNIDLAKAQGTSTMVLTAMNSSFSKKETLLWDYLNQYSLMTRVELNAKIKDGISDLQRKKDQQDVVPVDNVQIQKHYASGMGLSGESAVLHRIEPGTFRMGNDLGIIFNRGVKVTITKPFDMMSTQTTQELWRKVVSLAQLRFPGKYALKEDPSSNSNKGDLNPVDMVSHDDIIIWLTVLNELSQQGDPLLAEFIRGHKDGDIYRLPTMAEREFVARGRGKYRTNYHWGNDVTKFAEYGWGNKDSDDRTHPVAQKKPLTIDGKDFYDMHGNVGEWLHDWWGDELMGGNDPQGPATGRTRVFHQGSSLWGSRQMKIGDYIRYDSNFRSGFIGFRFLREVRP